MEKNEDYWRKKLTLKQYKILREKGTEEPYSGEYAKATKKGDYLCAACGSNLFSSDSKFDSSCGWPSFYDANKNSVKYSDDTSHSMHRIEVSCRNCGSHLGHIFD